MGSALQTTFDETPPKAFIGTLDGSRFSNKSTAINAEASASIPFGTPIAWKPSSALSDLDSTIPANSTDKLRGIVYRTDGYMPAFTDRHGTHGQLGADGLVPKTVMEIARAGRIFVKCKTGCSPGQPVYISYSAGSTYDAAGQFGNAAEASHTIDVSGRCMWDSTASAGEGAWLLFDFTKNA